MAAQVDASLIVFFENPDYFLIKSSFFLESDRQIKWKLIQLMLSRDLPRLH